jgi:UDP-N-acetylglucosamine diphosphorylase/glucosamine-1-phosphate N-acetyltransferase
MKERWDHLLQENSHFKTITYLQEKFPFYATDDNLFINSAVFPSPQLTEALLTLKMGERLVQGDVLLAARMRHAEAILFEVETDTATLGVTLFEQPVKQLRHLWDLFSLNDEMLRMDYQILTKGRTSAPVSSTNTVLGNDLFIEEGAKVECSIINSLSGPVYIGKGAEVMEGCMIRGPLAMGNNAVLKMGAKVYGATTLGEGCKVGGEVSNVIFYAQSSKAHDGFLGNSVIGEWCNIGADSNNSNLKNNYEEVKLWSECKKTFQRTGLQFCGLIMGDHSKLGINSMINTGTVIGVSCNVYGAGFPRNFIPSFSWGSANGFTEYQLEKAVSTAKRVFERRNIEFDLSEQKIFSTVFDRTSEQRNY